MSRTYSDWATWNHPEASKAWQGYGRSKGWKQEKTQPKGGKGGKDFVGYDGTRLSLSGFAPSARAMTGGDSKAKEPAQSDMAKIKALLKQCVQDPKSVDPNQVSKILEEDPNTQLREEQKLLNQRRRRQKRVDSLQKQIKTKEDSFLSWKASVKAMIKAEEVRHADAQQKLKEALEKALQESDDEKETMEVSDLSSDEEANPKQKENEELKRQIQATEARFQELAQKNERVTQQMEVMLSMMASTALPAEVDPTIGLNGTPIVTSPALCRVNMANMANLAPDITQDAMKAFRTQKKARDSPYTPPLRAPKPEEGTTEETKTDPPPPNHIEMLE